MDFITYTGSCFSEIIEITVAKKASIMLKDDPSGRMDLFSAYLKNCSCAQ